MALRQKTASQIQTGDRRAALYPGRCPGSREEPEGQASPAEIKKRALLRERFSARPAVTRHYAGSMSSRVKTVWSLFFDLRIRSTIAYTIDPRESPAGTNLQSYIQHCPIMPV